ncbi:MAG TPA: hypothetical protein VGF67_03970 [Ktedonobacteraceae bacterium]|jgi:hypothetical protein
MNQREEFEAPQQAQSIYQPKYPYTWSDQEQQGALPRDEPPITYGLYPGAPDSQGYQAGQPMVPWWARPQPGQNGPLIFAAIVIIALLVTLIMGGLGIAGIIFGSFAHLAGIVIGAFIAVLICFILLVTLVLSLLRRALSSRHRFYRRPPGP